MQKQNLEYRIFALKQEGKYENYGNLFNTGFKEAVKTEFNFDCIIFYNSQLILMDDRNILSCTYGPRDIGVYLDTNNFTYEGYDISNGILACTKSDFINSNGFTNNFFETNAFLTDFIKRIQIRLKKSIKRLPLVISIAKTSPEWKDLNLKDPRYTFGRLERSHLYDLDGLSSINYSLISKEIFPLFTQFNILPHFNIFDNFKKNKNTCDGLSTDDLSPENLLSKMTGTSSDCAITCFEHLECTGFVYIENELEYFNCYLVNECFKIETLPEDGIYYFQKNSSVSRIGSEIFMQLIISVSILSSYIINLA